MFYSIPYAKAWNSASPDSRTQAGIYQSSVLLWHQDSLVLSVPYAKARNSALTDSRPQTGISQSSVLLWHRNSLVLSFALCQSLEFSFAGFQDTSRYLPKPGEAFAPGQPCFIQYLVPKPGIQLHRIPGHKPVFTKALCCFGTGTALSYMLSYAKARNSALTDSRTQAGIYQSPVRLWHRNSLVVYVVLCQSLEFSFDGFQDTSRHLPKLCVALASGQPGFIRALCQSLEFSFDGF